MRFFNTTGPVNPADHYCIPPLERFDLDEVLALVRTKKYFVLHAPRQTGKTSALLALCDLLNTQGYGCVYTTVETARTARDDLVEAMQAVLARLGSQARSTLGDQFLDDAWPGILARFGPNEALGEALKRWSEASPKPLVLLIDEIDTLQGDPLLATLQQLRAGYPMRPGTFPQCVVLCGLRDVRDYRIRSTSSPFNIVAKSLRLGDFTQEETLALLDQHTEETGQAFTDDAREAIWTQTLGQPWLVNALAWETCFERKAGRDRSRAVSADDVAEAREQLIVRRVTHLDQLADKLREDRVRRVVEPMLSGADEHAFSNRDVEYVRDLGPDCPGQAGAHRQSHLRGGPAAGVGLGLAGDAGPEHDVVRGRGRQPEPGQADGGVPGLLPPPLGALEEPFHVRGGVAADSVAGVPAPGGERGRAHRAGVWVGSRSGGPAACLAAERAPGGIGGRAGAGVRGGVQGGARRGWVGEHGS